LIVLEKLSALLRPVSRCLQAVGNDLVNALSDIRALQSKLNALRSNCEHDFEEIFSEACRLGDAMDVSKEEMYLIPRAGSASGRCKYKANAGEQQQTSSSYYRINVYIPLLDAIVRDLELRFSTHHEKVAKLSRLVPSFIKTATWADIFPAFTRYACFLDCESVVQGEFELWKEKCTMLDSSSVVTAASALSSCSREVFPNIHTLLHILAVLPVTTAEPERVFSNVQRTLSCIRATMTEDRLESLILLEVHRKRTPSANAVLTEFAARGARKLKLAL
jgi:hypothetical protein